MHGDALCVLCNPVRPDQWRFSPRFPRDNTKAGRSNDPFYSMDALECCTLFIEVGLRFESHIGRLSSTLAKIMRSSDESLADRVLRVGQAQFEQIRRGKKRVEFSYDMKLNARIAVVGW